MTTPRFDADALRAAFELTPGVNDLNSAGQTPRLRSVLAAGARALAQSTQPWTLSMDAWLALPNTVRAAAAAVFGCHSADLALVPSVAYASATAVANLPLRPGQAVLSLAGEHPSAVYAWAVAADRQGAQLRQLARPDGASWSDVIVAAIAPEVAVVVVPPCHWLDGRRVDLGRVAAAARAVGAALVVDATQALGVLEIDIPGIDPDFLFAAGHKWLLGAPGLAYLYAAPRHHQGFALEEHAWSRQGGLISDEREQPLPARVAGAARLDSGSVHGSLPLAMASAALGQLSTWGVAGIRQHLQRWQQGLLAELAARGLGDWIAVADQPHLCALRPPRADAADALRLADFLARHGIITAARGAAVRISPYLHSSDRDAAQLADALCSWQRRLAPT